MNLGSLKHRIYPTRCTEPAIGTMIKEELWINITTDIIIFTMANDTLTPKIRVGLVSPTNNGSTDSEPVDIESSN
jgi:hypothetical protein